MVSALSPIRPGSQFLSAPWESGRKYQPSAPYLFDIGPSNRIQTSGFLPTALSYADPYGSRLEAGEYESEKCVGASCRYHPEDISAFIPGRLPQQPGTNARFSSFNQGFSYKNKSPVFFVALHRSTTHMTREMIKNGLTTPLPVAITGLPSVTNEQQDFKLSLDSRKFFKSGRFKISAKSLRALFGWS